MGDELSLVERFVPLLRRSNLSVQRLLRPSGPIQLAEEAPRDLIVVVAPIANAGRLFARARAEGSPWRHTPVLLVAERSTRSELDPALTRFANRMVPTTVSPDEFQREVADLLDVAPRVAVQASVQLRLVTYESEPRILPVENLSTTGMFVASDEPLPVGTVFGFALALPTEAEPILGQAGVVRKATDGNGGHRGIGVRFLSLGGESSARLDRLVRHQRERSGGVRPAEGSSADAKRGGVGASTGSTPRPVVPQLPQLKEELAELQALLDGHLRRGLARRLGSIDWYLTGMERGLDSLQSFSAVLEATHAARAAAGESPTRAADLALVRRRLGELAQPQQDARARIAILLELRAPLDRLRRELGSGAGVNVSSASRPPDAVAQVLAEIRRLIAARKSFASVRVLLSDMGSARYLFVPGAQKRFAERICQEYRPQANSLGFATPDRITKRKGRKDAHAALERELRALDQRLAAIHEKLFARRFEHLATRDHEADLLDTKALSILIDTLAPGRDYLDRAFSAYHHALELAGADPALLERAATLAATIRRAEREQSSASHAMPSTAQSATQSAIPSAIQSRGA